MPTKILKSNPGIKRDGTKYEGDFYVDGQWMRFQRGLPRKIGGYRSISKYLTETSRGFISFTQQLLQYCHSGGSGTLQRFTIDASKNASIISDRTPSSLVVDSSNRWMFQAIYDSSSSYNALVAHVAPNGLCSCNDVGGQIFYGDMLTTAALAAVMRGLSEVSCSSIFERSKPSVSATAWMRAAGPTRMGVIRPAW